MKIKTFPPTMREKKRYIAYSVKSDYQISRDDVVKAIWNSILGFFGENTASQFNFWVKDYDELNQKGFLVCGHRHTNEIITALALVNVINGKRLYIQTKGISGTLKSLKRKFLNTVKDSDNIEGKFLFQGNTFEAVRIEKGFVYSIPKDKNLLNRLNRMEMKFISFVKEEVKINATDA